MVDVGQSKPEGTVAGLADAITALRAELNEARQRAEGEDLQFRMETVTMEFSVEATADAEAKGGVRFWVVELGASGKVGRGTTNKVTLELKPCTSGGASPYVNDDDD
jgi:hypothetical protein